MTKNQNKEWKESQERLFEFMELDYPYHRPKSQFHKHPNREKILSFSDPHAPFVNNVVKNHVVTCEKDAGIIVVPGDLGDYYSKSRFRKMHHQSFSVELRSVFKFVEFLATNWETVKIMVGNHDQRSEKHLSDKIDGETDMLIMTEQNMLGRLTNYFDNIELVGTQLDNTKINLTHIYQLGDIIFTHGELSMKQSTAVLDRVEEWIDNWGELLELKPYHILAQAHNHRAVEENVSYGKRLLIPTASNPFSIGFEYIYGSRMIGKPPQVGYSLFYQNNGDTDINSAKNVVFKVTHGKTQPLM